MGVMGVLSSKGAGRGGIERQRPGQEHAFSVHLMFGEMLQRAPSAHYSRGHVNTEVICAHEFMHSAPPDLSTFARQFFKLPLYVRNNNISIWAIGGAGGPRIDQRLHPVQLVWRLVRHCL